jgi:transmembrane sensor
MRQSTLDKLAIQQSAMRELTAREARHVALPQRPAPSKPIGRIALFAVLAGLAAFVIADGPMRLRADLVSTIKDMPRMTLPDGSQVQLDSGSAIDVAYDITQRRVRLLRGEAFFQVARDATRPFVVEAQNGTITGGVITDDSGTPSGAAFDVRLTRAGAVVAVTDQLVSVAPPDKPNGDQYAPVELHAGQRIAYGLDGSMSPLRAADPQQTASWRQGKLEVRNQTLASVIERIDRHSPTPIIILGNALGQRRVSGSFDLSKPRAAVDMLAERFGLHALHIGPLLTVLRD